MPEYHLLICNSSGKVNYYPLTNNGNLIKCRIPLYQSTENKPFKIVICKESDRGQLDKYLDKYKVFQTNNGSLNNPTFLDLSMEESGLNVKTPMLWQEVTDINNVSLDDSDMVLANTPLDVLFILDATITKIKTKDDNKEKTDRFANAIDIIQKIVDDFTSKASTEQGSLIFQDRQIPKYTSGNFLNIRYGLILFGEYSIQKHPINNFDSEGEPKYDVCGIQNIQNIINNNDFTYSNKFANAQEINDALKGINENIDDFRVDGGDFEDCLELALKKANEMGRRDESVKFLFVIADSPPHPHKDDSNYTSQQRYIYKSDDINWKNEVQRLKDEKMYVFTLYDEPEFFSEFSEEEQEQFNNIWMVVGDYKLRLSTSTDVLKEIEDKIKKHIEESSERAVNIPLDYPFIEAKVPAVLAVADAT